MQTLARVQRVPGLASLRPSDPMTRRRSHRLHSPIATGRSASPAGSWGLAPASVPPRASSVATRVLPASGLAKLWGEERLADLTLLMCLGGGGGEAAHVTVLKRVLLHRAILQAHGALDAILSASRLILEEGGRLPAAVVMVAGEEEASAAEAVLRLMYAGGLPAGLSVQQLARMRTVASRWGAELIAAACKAARDALAQREERAATTLEGRLVSVRRSISDLASELLHDVHLLLTTPTLLQLFLELPFEGVLAWAGSDSLVVDSENSVVVALDCWVRLCRGKGCSGAQLLQLSSLVRVKHLTPSFLNYAVTLPWWHHSKEEMQRFAVRQVEEGATRSFPAAWLAAPRQQLPRDVLRQRTTITWAVPRQELEDALSKPFSRGLLSPPVYFAGSSVALGLWLYGEDKPKAQRQVEAYLRARDYLSGQDEKRLIVPNTRPFALNGYTITRTMPDGSEVILSTSTQKQLVEGYTDNDPKFSLDTSQLDQLLVHGHLVLRVSLHPAV